MKELKLTPQSPHWGGGRYVNFLNDKSVFFSFGYGVVCKL